VGRLACLWCENGGGRGPDNVAKVVGEKRRAERKKFLGGGGKDLWYTFQTRESSELLGRSRRGPRLVGGEKEIGISFLERGRRGLVGKRGSPRISPVLIFVEGTGGRGLRGLLEKMKYGEGEKIVIPSVKGGKIARRGGGGDRISYWTRPPRNGRRQRKG